jgi:hypothetical protein
MTTSQPTELADAQPPLEEAHSQAPEQAQSESDAEKRKPLFSKRTDNGVEVSVWPNTFEKGPAFRVRVSRSYRGGDGQWKTANLFSPDQIKQLRAALDEVTAWLEKQPS